MRACADCKYKAPTHKGWYCRHPYFPVDVVAGVIWGEPCETERKLTGATRCGPEGRRFEPTLGARLIHLFTGEDF